MYPILNLMLSYGNDAGCPGKKGLHTRRKSQLKMYRQCEKCIDMNDEIDIHFYKKYQM